MNKNKICRYVRILTAAVIGILAILAFAGIFYPVRIFDLQVSALAQRVIIDFSLAAALLFAGVLLLTLLFGRIYCSTLCPFGLLQEFLSFAFRRKNLPQYRKSRSYKYFIAVVVFGTLIGGTAYLIRLIDPYSLFGSGISGAYLGIGAIFIVAVLVWFKGRLFCAEICPVGAVLGLLSKFSYNKIYIKEENCIACGLCARNCPTASIDYKNHEVDDETCVKCLKCPAVCPKGAIVFGHKKGKEAEFSPARRRLLIGGAAFVVLAAAVKGGMEIGKSIAAKVRRVILPAGADNAEKFANKCLNCNLCVQNCPMKILKKADNEFGAVHIDYASGFCDYDCHKCSEVCPSGAIRRISLAEKQKTRIGLASINPDVCIQCGLCVAECPRGIISKEDGEVPLIDSSGCIGCGVCHSVCPVQAISIFAVQEQQVL